MQRRKHNGSTAMHTSRKIWYIFMNSGMKVHIIQCLSLELSLLVANFRLQYCLSVTLFWMISASFPSNRWLMVGFAPFFAIARRRKREAFLSPTIWGMVVSSALNSLTYMILSWIPCLCWEWILSDCNWRQLSTEVAVGVILSAVGGVLSENFLIVFFSKLLFISFSLDMLLLSLVALKMFSFAANLEIAGCTGTLGFAWVSIHPLISQLTTFLLELKSNSKKVAFSGEFIVLPILTEY